MPDREPRPATRLARRRLEGRAARGDAKPAKRGGAGRLGAVPQRAAVGHGARGLQRRRHAWDYFPHDHARSRAYRWGEDGIAGICDDQQRLCLALALWNGRDPILKERLFGLTNGEGNHGEDVKELYYYLDATPTHSYLKMLYKYPQARVSLRAAGRGEPPPRHGRAGVRAARHRRLRRRPLLRRLRRIRQGRRRRHPDAGHGRTTAARSRRRCTCCRSSGFATPGRGRPSRRKPALARVGPTARSRRSIRSSGDYRLYCDGDAELLFCDNETNVRAAVRRARRARATSRTPSTSTSSTAIAAAVNPGADRHEGGGALSR